MPDSKPNMAQVNILKDSCLCAHLANWCFVCFLLSGSLCQELYKDYLKPSMINDRFSQLRKAAGKNEARVPFDSTRNNVL